MNFPTLTCVVVMTLLNVVVPTGEAAEEQTQNKDRRYNIIDLGTLGGTFSQPSAINDVGQVTGTSSLPDESVAHAFLWDSGKMTDLGTLGGPISVGAGINDSGEVVVGADTTDSGGLQNTICATSAICRMFIWKNGLEVPDLGTLPGGTDTGIFSRLAFPGIGDSLINNNREAAGTGDIPSVDPNNPPLAISHAFRWKDGVITDLGTLGGNDSEANAINDRGQVIGDSETTPAPDPVLGFPLIHGFLWHKDVMTDLGTLGGKLSWAAGINNRGQVVGVSTLPRDLTVNAFLWQGGAATSLGIFPGDTASAANGINNQGEIVGASAGPSVLRAVLWQKGKVADLNSLICPNSGWQLQWAVTINARGQIAGFGIHNNETHAFLLDPCDQEKAEIKRCEDTGTNDAIQSNAAPVTRVPNNVTQVESPLMGRGILDWVRARRFPGLRVPVR